MKKLLLSTFVLLTVMGCSVNERAVNQEMSESEKNAPATIEDREKYVESNEYIIDHENTTEDELNYLTIRLNQEFTKMPISEQYLYLVDFFEEYNEKYGHLFETFGSLNEMLGYVGETEFPTYEVHLRTFEFVGINLNIDREVGDRPSDNILELLDEQDKDMVSSGKKAGLTLAETNTDIEVPIKNTIITTSGEIKGALARTNAVSTSTSTSNPSTSNDDSETYIDGMTGNEWVSLTDNQKFHAVSNALYNLDQNGFTITEDEYYFISALDAFYTDNATMSTPVNEALATSGFMSGAILK